MGGRFEPEALRALVKPYLGAPAWRVAYSGGLDSTVLLHGLVRLESRPPVVAVHVHHGLLPEADAWTAHCEAQARRLGLALRVLRVDAAPASGESPEAAARTARYAALKDILQAGEVLFTAHHADDQAETLLLQLLRGAGPAGLAGMPREKRFGPGRLVRPLLPWPRAELAAYARDQGLTWVEDPSNWDRDVDRSFLRAEVMPVLRARWPGLARTLGRAARLQAEAAEVLRADALGLVERARGSRPGTLSARALRALPRARAANLVHHWIQQRGLPVPGRARLERILEEVAASRHDAQPCVRWPGAEVRRHRDDLYAMEPSTPPAVRRWRWDQRRALVIPELGVTLRRDALLDQGFRLPPPSVSLDVRLREGGERCAMGSGPAKSLARIFQEAGVPPWERDRLPLIYHEGRLLGIVGLGTFSPPGT